MTCKGFRKTLPDSVFSKKQLEMGVRTEMEHTTDKSCAKVIAKHHLAENSRYYTYLTEMERKFDKQMARHKKR